MGQKVNPNGLRIGVNKDWEAKWFAGKKNFSEYLVEDVQIRNYIKNVYKPAPLSKEAPVAEGENQDSRPHLREWEDTRYRGTDVQIWALS